MDKLLNFFVSSAYAADTSMPGQAPQGGGFQFMLMFVLLIVFVYFLIWRPQSKRAKEQQTLLNSLTKGDEVVTAGGLLGRINKIADQYVVLNVGANADVVMQKSAIVSVLPKGTIKTLE